MGMKLRILSAPRTSWQYKAIQSSSICTLEFVEVGTAENWSCFGGWTILRFGRESGREGGIDN
jgi:hypothetical protein